MKKSWGFHRGFNRWTEYRLDTPSGNCAHITEEALDWLSAAPDQPFFLFLHYYEPHAPYDSPDEWRARFGTSLSRDDVIRTFQRRRHPWQPFRDSDLLQQLIGCYDSAIAWLDRELEWLLAGLPENTLVVIFSDHGEAFKEHGRLEHASLYEEDLHVALLM